MASAAKVALEYDVRYEVFLLIFTGKFCSSSDYTQLEIEIASRACLFQLVSVKWGMIE